MNPETPPIPDQGEVFCTSCRMYRPRASIVSARWSGPKKNQPLFNCVRCEARARKHVQKS